MFGAKSSKIGPVGAGEAVILNRDDSWSLLNVHVPSFITGQSMIIIMVILIAAFYFCIRNRRRNRRVRHISAATMMDIGLLNRHQLTQTVPIPLAIVEHPKQQFQDLMDSTHPTAPVPRAPRRSTEMKQLQNLALRYGRDLA